MNKIEFSLPDILVDKLESPIHCRCCQADFADSLSKEQSLSSHPFTLAWIPDCSVEHGARGSMLVLSLGLRKFSRLPPLLRDMLLPCEQAQAELCQLKSFKQLNIIQHLSMWQRAIQISRTCLPDPQRTSLLTPRFMKKKMLVVLTHLFI